MRVTVILLFLIAHISCKNSMLCYAREPVERFSAVYDMLEEIPEPEKEFTGSDGATYKLLNSELEEILLPERQEQAENTLVYEGVGKHELIPQAADIEVWDEESKNRYTARFPLQSTRYIKERWADFHFRLTFHEYDAQAYLLNDSLIEAGMALEELAAQEKEVLELAGLKRENCRGFTYAWKGEAYTDASGVLCRDVETIGERRVWDCHALYRGNIKIPGYSRYRMRYSYLETAEVQKENDAPVQEQKVSTQENIKRPLRDRVLKVIKQCLEVTVGLFFILLAILGFRFLMKLGGKAEKE